MIKVVTTKGIVVVEPINDEYMGELHIKED